MFRKVTILFILAIFALMSTFGCSNWSKKEKGAAIGATGGAVIGGLIGNKAGNTAVGAILGAVVGGAAGAYIGNQMDKQAEEMQRDLEGAKVERVGEGIKITWASGILFDVNSAELRPAAKSNLTDLARILNKYPESNIQVDGHTDSTGTAEWNMELSKRRAESVGMFLGEQSVNYTRLKMVAWGETMPADAANSTDALQANRRVEVGIFANDKLKDAAMKQTQGQ
ncbi:MAG: OmpA family protein [bacterium]|nr:OmpA family protein [bacterium]